MRASFVFSEVVTGLRRNVTMTIAMVITTAISLSLLGGGLLIVRVIDKMQTIYHDAVGVSVYLDGPTSTNDANCTQQVCAGLLSQLKAAPGVTSVQFESRDPSSRTAAASISFKPRLRTLCSANAYSQVTSAAPGSGSSSSAVAWSDSASNWTR